MSSDYSKQEYRAFLYSVFLYTEPSCIKNEKLFIAPPLKGLLVKLTLPKTEIAILKFCTMYWESPKQATNDLSNIKTLQGDGHNKNCVLARTIKKMSVYLCADLLCIAFLMSFLCIKFCIIRMLRVHCSSKCDSVLSALEPRGLYLESSTVSEAVWSLSDNPRPLRLLITS